MNEALKYKAFIERYTTGIGLDLGSGGYKVFENAITVDRRKLPKVDVVDDIETLNLVREDIAPVQFVLASHCLEHVKTPEACVSMWSGLIKPGGYLILILPDPRLYTEDNPEHLFMFLPGEVQLMCSALGLDQVLYLTDMGYGRKDFYSFVLVYQKARKD